MRLGDWGRWGGGEVSASFSEKAGYRSSSFITVCKDVGEIIIIVAFMSGMLHIELNFHPPILHTHIHTHVPQLGGLA